MSSRFHLPGLVLAMLALLAGAGTGHEENKKKAGKLVSIVGLPDKFSPGNAAGYYIGVTKGGKWSLRTTTPGKRPQQFAGVIAVQGGLFSMVEGVKIDKKGKDRFPANPQRTHIQFDFKTRNHFDGVDFLLSNPNARVTFQLLHNGMPASPKKVFVGKGGNHPPTVPFTLP